MKYQARPKWDLERSLRRRALTRTFMTFATAVAIVVVGWLFLVLVFALA